VRSRKVPLLFGGYDQKDGKDFNAFFFLSPEPIPGFPGDEDMQVYRKNILLLFGEFIPGAEQIAWIRNQFPQVGNFGRGPGPQVFKVRSAKGQDVVFSPIICYEALFSDYVIKAARAGSQLILNITNDSWFGPWGEPELHLSLTVFRGIETRLPQLRSTNTGISTLVLPSGEMPQRTGIGTQEVMNATVPLITPVWTLMKTLGDWFGLTALLTGAALFFWINGGFGLGPVLRSRSPGGPAGSSGRARRRA
jgi:apolipoprotein N-acyltransferase